MTIENSSVNNPRYKVKLKFFKILTVLNNSLCRNGIYYQSSVESLINFYIRQWCFDKAEYIYKKYINIPNDDFNKFQFYKDLSYILKKEKNIWNLNPYWKKQIF